MEWLCEITPEESANKTGLSLILWSTENVGTTKCYQGQKKISRTLQALLNIRASGCLVLKRRHAGNINTEQILDKKQLLNFIKVTALQIQNNWKKKQTIKQPYQRKYQAQQKQLQLQYKNKTKQKKINKEWFLKLSKSSIQWWTKILSHQNANWKMHIPMKIFLSFTLFLESDLL